jgi:hypothetical protein
MQVHPGDTMELISIKDLSLDSKIQLLKELGYSSDGIFVLDQNGQKVTDMYVDVEVQISNMIIAPGSTIILDHNPISISRYLEDYKVQL